MSASPAAPEPGPAAASGERGAAHFLDARRGTEVYLTFCGAYLLGYMLRSINAVIAPNLVADLGLSQTDLGFLVAAFMAAFAVMQLPVGVLFDRYGVRRVLTVLLVIAAAGSLLFALSSHFVVLWLARALIGVGTSGTLMGSYKVFAERYPKVRMPQLSAWVLLAGSFGALVATVPTSLALVYIGWRGVFVIVGVLFLIAVLVVARLLPPAVPTHAAAARLPVRVQIASYKGIFGSPLFWIVAPVTFAFSGTFMAVQGLWAGPWLGTVGGLDQAGVARGLLYFNLSLMVGHFIFGNLIGRLEARGVALHTVLAGGMVVLVLAYAWLALGGFAPWPPLPWLVIGLCTSTNNLTYPILTRIYPLELSGRVNTSLNLLAFIGAFLFQAGVGALLDLAMAAGLTAPAAYALAFGLLWILQIGALTVLLLGVPRLRRAQAGAAQ